MLNRFFSHSENQPVSIDSLINAYREYEQQYILKIKNETTEEAIETAWLAIGIEQAKLPAPMLYEFCRDGRAFSVTERRFIQIVPSAANAELGSIFSLVHIKNDQDLRPFAREAKGLDLSKILEYKETPSSANLYVDPANTNSDCEYLIQLSTKYSENMMGSHMDQPAPSSNSASTL